MRFLVMFAGGFLFPPLWFLAVGGAISESHSKQVSKARREQAAHHRAGAQYDQNQAAIWRKKYQQERNNRIATGQSMRSLEAARARENREHTKRMEANSKAFERIVSTANERNTRMPGRLDKIRSIANSSRGSTMSGSKPTPSSSSGTTGAKVR